MLKFPAPAEINGRQLAQELGLDPLAVRLAENELLIDAPEKNKDKIAAVIASHVPAAFVDFKATAKQKLIALGLNDDEITALLG